MSKLNAANARMVPNWEEVGPMLLATMERIATGQFDCAPRQQSMAMQAAAEAAVMAVRIHTAGRAAAPTGAAP